MITLWGGFRSRRTEARWSTEKRPAPKVALALGFGVFSLAGGVGRCALCRGWGAGRGALCGRGSLYVLATCPPGVRDSLDGRVFRVRGALSFRCMFDARELGGENGFAERLSDGRFELIRLLFCRLLFCGRFALEGRFAVLFLAELLLLGDVA